MVLKKNNIALTKPTIGYITLLLTRHSKYFNLDLLGMIVVRFWKC